jgi:hypothetical protein
VSPYFPVSNNATTSVKDGSPVSPAGSTKCSPCDSESRTRNPNQAEPSESTTGMLSETVNRLRGHHEQLAPTDCPNRLTGQAQDTAYAMQPAKQLAPTDGTTGNRLSCQSENNGSSPMLPAKQLDWTNRLALEPIELIVPLSVSPAGSASLRYEFEGYFFFLTFDKYRYRTIKIRYNFYCHSFLINIGTHRIFINV